MNHSQPVVLTLAISGHILMDQFVGIPYIAHGRGYDGADCWGIVYLFYRDVLKTPIPDYTKPCRSDGLKVVILGL